MNSRLRAEKVDESLLEEERRVLKQRAVELSQEATSDAELNSLLQVIEFTISGESYGFVLSEVREVCLVKDLTPVPCTPAFVLGIINLHGEILTVVDLRSFFDLPAGGRAVGNRIVVLRSEDRQLGVLADAIGGVMAVSLRELQTSLPTLSGIRADYLRGITGERLVILDAAKMLSDPHLVVYEEVEG